MAENTRERKPVQFGYIRVSTATQAIKGNSLSEQQAQLMFLYPILLSIGNSIKGPAPYISLCLKATLFLLFVLILCNLRQDLFYIIF